MVAKLITAKRRLPEPVITWVGRMNYILQLLYSIFSEQSRNVAWTTVLGHALKPSQAVCYTT